MLFLNAEQFSEDPTKDLGTFYNHDFHTPFLLSVFVCGEAKQHQHSGNHNQDKPDGKQRGNQESHPKSSKAASGISVTTTASHKKTPPPFRSILCDIAPNIHIIFRNGAGGVNLLNKKPKGGQFLWK